MALSSQPSDEDIDFVREIAGEGSFEFIATLIDNLNDAQWSRAQDLITAWTDYAPGSVRYGSQANVIVYVSENPVVNAIGRLWMRIVAVLTYVS